MAPRRSTGCAQALSLIFGTEAFVVLKDIWGLDGDDARDVALWSAHALVRAAVAEAADAERAAVAAGHAIEQGGKQPRDKGAAHRWRRVETNLGRN